MTRVPPVPEVFRVLTLTPPRALERYGGWKSSKDQNASKLVSQFNITGSQDNEHYRSMLDEYATELVFCCRNEPGEPVASVRLSISG